MEYEESALFAISKELTEIVDTVNEKAEYNDYWCDDEDVGKAKVELRFGLQQVIDINGQKITIALEPAIIYKANKPEDIWLFDYNIYLYL